MLTRRATPTKKPKAVLPPPRPSELCWAKVGGPARRWVALHARTPGHCCPSKPTLSCVAAARAQVPGWQWWPARVLQPAAADGQQKQKEPGQERERVVLFLIDNTVATVPANLPQFDVHYSRFLQACYANKVGAPGLAAAQHEERVWRGRWRALPV